MDKYVFIDESGDPQFYAKKKRPLWIEPGFIPIMLLGMVTTDDRKSLRKKVIAFQQEILNNPLLNSIYSVKQPGWFLHASNDHSDINLKTVEFLKDITGFKFSAVVARKNPEIFINKHNGKPADFYFDLLHKLMELDSMDGGCKYHLYLSQRQSNTEQRFSDAFRRVIQSKKMEDSEIRFSSSIVRSCDFPEMSVVDYLLWALQRYILKEEKRYFTVLEHHYENILDIYDKEGEGVLYTANNKFDLSKASPFMLKN
jgi:hypothetical protein